MSAVKNLTTIVAVLVALAFVLAPAPARAQDNMLRGPHPFLKDNELDAYVLLALGLSDAPSGTKLALDYNFKLKRPLWLDLQLNLQLSGCHTTPGVMTCGFDTGKAFGTGGRGLGGPCRSRWCRSRRRAAACLRVPEQPGAVGSWRGRAPAFFFDWLGLGVELGFSLGRVAYDATFPGSHAYAVFDFGGGIQFQF
jgi:hypothetical protein